jgi:hypothetical protein
MHKGPDYIKVMTKDLYRNLQAGGFDMTDDLEMFQVFRYLSAGEAMCRIFGYDLSRSSVGCTRLTVHLEGMDWVGEVGGNSSQSQLLQYFSRPEELEPLLYLQYFSSYSLQKASAAVKSAADEAGGGLVSPPSGNDYYVDNCNPPNKVTKRNVGSLHVARMYPVQSTQGELYYLRRLLTIIPGTSFKDMRTHQGVVFDTYREAARAHGILNDEVENIEALGLVAADPTSRPSDIRHTFVIQAVQGGEGVQVQDVYRHFKYHMALDINSRGHIQPPGRANAGTAEENEVYRLLPVRDYEVGIELDLDNYPVHEYHLCIMDEKAWWVCTTRLSWWPWKRLNKALQNIQHAL